MTIGQYGCELPNKSCSSSGLDKISRKINDTGGTDYTNGSGRPLSLISKIGHKTALTLGITAQRVYTHPRIRDMQHLKDLLGDKWGELPQYEIGESLISLDIVYLKLSK